MMKTNRMMWGGAAVLAMTLMFSSCAYELKSFSSDDGERLSDVRQLKGFEEVEILGSPTVAYTQADSSSVRLEGTKTAIDDVIVEVKGKRLCVRNRGKIGIVNITRMGDNGVTVFVTSPDLTAIRLSGSGDFYSERRIDSDKMEVSLRGSGDISLSDVICDDCRVELIGSGDIGIDRLESHDVSASLTGSGDVDMKLCNVVSTRLSLKGSGDMDADFREGCRSVVCELRGSGDINLSGTVSRFSKQKSGSGDIDTDKLTIKD